jgi:tetratricopeptide (TPR) repeat protein
MKLIYILFFWLSTSIVNAQTKNKQEINGDSIVTKLGIKKTIVYFEKELKTKPNNEEILRWLGALNIEDKNLTKGELYYNTALKVNPKCAPCVKNIGRIYALRNNNTKAKEMLDKAVSMEPTNASIILERAKFKHNTNDNFGAKLDYNKTIKLDPRNVDVFYNRSILNYNEGSNVSALLDIDAAIELEPRAANLYQQRASVYFAMNKFKDAIVDMTEAIKYDSSNIVRYYNRAALHNQIGDVDNALNDYSLAIKANPDEYKSYNYRAHSKYQKEDMDGFCDDLKICYNKLKKINPKDSLKYELEYSLGNFCDTTKITFYYQRGIAYYNLNKFSDAVTIYSKGLQKVPTNAMSLNFRGNAYMRMFEYKKAIADYEASIKNDDNLLNDLKANQQHTKINFDSIAFFKDAFNASTLRSMAECYFELGDYNASMLYLNKALYLNKDVKAEKEEMYNVRGNINMALGNFVDAKKDFDTSIILNSTFALGYVNRAIALMNAVNKVKIKTISIGSNFINNTLIPKWTIPVNNNKTNNNVILAIADCDRALAIAPDFAFAYYTRARINKNLGNVSYCRDFFRAKELGIIVENMFLEDCKK